MGRPRNRPRLEQSPLEDNFRDTLSNANEFQLVSAASPASGVEQAQIGGLDPCLTFLDHNVDSIGTEYLHLLPKTYTEPLRLEPQLLVCADGSVGPVPDTMLSVGLGDILSDGPDESGVSVICLRLDCHRT